LDRLPINIPFIPVLFIKFCWDHRFEVVNL
jgi:hypothetical protein